MDYDCREGGRPSALLQAAADLKAEKTERRKLKALLKALDETALSTETFITYEDEEEIMVAGKTIRIMPAYFRYIQIFYHRVRSTLLWGALSRTVRMSHRSRVTTCPVFW